MGHGKREKGPPTSTSARNGAFSQAWLGKVIGNQLDHLLYNRSNASAQGGAGLGQLASRCSDGRRVNRSECERGFCNISLANLTLGALPSCEDDDALADKGFASAKNCSDAGASTPSSGL